MPEVQQFVGSSHVTALYNYIYIWYFFLCNQINQFCLNIKSSLVHLVCQFLLTWLSWVQSDFSFLNKWYLIFMFQRDIHFKWFRSKQFEKHRPTSRNVAFYAYFLIKYNFHYNLTIDLVYSLLKNKITALIHTTLTVQVLYIQYMKIWRQPNQFKNVKHLMKCFSCISFIRRPFVS